MSRSARSRTTSFFKAAISASSARIRPFPGKAAAGAAVNSRIHSAQNAFSYIEITGGLGNRHTTLRNQLHRFDLELAAELPSRHIHSPVPWSRSYLRVHEIGSRPRKGFRTSAEKGADALQGYSTGGGSAA